MQVVQLSEEVLEGLQSVHILTLNVGSIDGVVMKGRRETLAYLMRIDEWDVVFLQETHHTGDGQAPAYCKLFESAGYTGVV